MYQKSARALAAENEIKAAQKSRKRAQEEIRSEELIAQRRHAETDPMIAIGSEFDAFEKSRKTDQEAIRADEIAAQKIRAEEE